MANRLKRMDGGLGWQRRPSPVSMLWLLALVFSGSGCESIPPRFDSISGFQRPPEHIIELPGSPTRFGIGTEEGILCLAEDAREREIRVPIGENGFTDEVIVDRVNENLALLRPLSSQVPEARIGLFPARNDDEIVIAVLNGGQEIDLVRTELYREGSAGDLLELPFSSDEIADFVRTHVGVGVYAWRDRFFQLVGILNGVYVVDEPVVAFIGLEEIARVLPAGSSFFERRLRALRPDFEHGVVPRPTDNTDGSGIR